jgi:phosphatidylserine decarboxylase
MTGIAVLGYTYFSRNPIRITPFGDNVISPADGIIENISDNKIDIHIGIGDVHWQRSPVDGIISDIYGNSSDNYIKLNSPKYGDFIIQRKGVPFINNVITFVKTGDIIYKGDILGRITFGSFCSITIPPDLMIKVDIGQHVLAGETVIAKYDN